MTASVIKRKSPSLFRIVFLYYIYRDLSRLEIECHYIAQWIACLYQQNLLYKFTYVCALLFRELIPHFAVKCVRVWCIFYYTFFGKSITGYFIRFRGWRDAKINTVRFNYYIYYTYMYYTFRMYGKTSIFEIPFHLRNLAPNSFWKEW